MGKKVEIPILHIYWTLFLINSYDYSKNRIPKFDRIRFPEFRFLFQVNGQIRIPILEVKYHFRRPLILIHQALCKTT